MVRRYRNDEEYAQDLERLGAEGWIVADIAREYPRQGLTALLLAPFRWRRLPARPHLVVTYERENAPPG
jgi:hypothetical protein